MRSCVECGRYAKIIDRTTEYGWCFVMEDIPVVRQEGRHFYAMNCPFEDPIYLLKEYFKENIAEGKKWKMYVKLVRDIFLPLSN